MILMFRRFNNFQKSSIKFQIYLQQNNEETRLSLKFL